MNDARNWTRFWVDSTPLKWRTGEAPLKAAMRGQPDIPCRFKSIAEMRCYLLSKGVAPEQMDGLPRLWRRYSNWLRWLDGRLEGRKSRDLSTVSLDV
jgi:hypothetical protein